MIRQTDVQFSRYLVFNTTDSTQTGCESRRSCLCLLRELHELAKRLES